MESELVWRLLIGQLMFIVFSITAVFRSGGGKAKGAVDLAGEPLWILMPLRLTGLVMWGSILWYLFGAETMGWARFDAPFWLRVAGLFLSLSMLPMVLWMFKHVGLNLTVTVKTRQDHQLVKTGPYRWIRHPLYTFGGLMFAGLGLASACWLLLVAMVVGWIFLALRMPLEEQGLVDKFGDEYREYQKTTGAMFPRLGVRNELVGR